MDAGINHYTYISAILLGIGVFLTAFHKNIVKTLIGIFLMFLASVLNFAAFSGILNFNTEGQFIVFSVSAICLMTVLAGIALAYSFYKTNKTLNIGNND